MTGAATEAVPRNSTADRSLTGCLVTNIPSESGKGEIFLDRNFQVEKSRHFMLLIFDFVYFI
jgi:hypothetical protein